MGSALPTMSEPNGSPPAQSITPRLTLFHELIDQPWQNHRRNEESGALLPTDEAGADRWFAGLVEATSFRRGESKRHE